MGRRRAVRRELCVPGFAGAVAVYGDHAGGEAVEYRRLERRCRRVGKGAKRRAHHFFHGSGGRSALCFLRPLRLSSLCPIRTARF